MNGTLVHQMGPAMIVNFRDEWLRAFFEEDIRSRNIPSDLEDRLFRKLQMIDDATNDQDLRSPPSNHFEKLRGRLEKLHSIRIASNGGLSSSGTAPGVKRRKFISTTTATDEARDVDDQAQAGEPRRNSH